MPDQQEIKAIKQAVATAYAFDFAAIEKDSDNPPCPSITNGIVSTGKEIYLKPISRSSSTPLVPDLERFKFSDVLEDETIRDRLIEQNLDDAVRYLQHCTALRKEYGETAKLFLDTSIKSQEFFRLDAIHTEEVGAGLYRIPYDEANSNLEAAEKALKAAQAQNQIVEDLYHTSPSGPSGQVAYGGALSPNGINGGKGIQTSIDAQIHLAQYPYQGDGGRQKQAGSDAKALAEYRSLLEQASWQFNVKNTSMSLAELESRREIARIKREYALKDICFRSRRANVATQLAYVQCSENHRDNSILNYSQRLESIATLFDLSARQLVARVHAIRRAATQLYDLDTPLEVPEQGKMLDTLATWLLKVQDQIGKFRRKQKTSIFTIWASDRIDLNAALGRKPFQIAVTVQTGDLPIARGLLRGIALEYIGKGDRPVRFNVMPPSASTGNIGTSGQLLTPLVFGRVCPFAPDADIKPQHSDAVWNGNPNGQWQIESSDDLARANLTDVALHLWLAYA